MKRILYICPSSGLGGAETFLQDTFQYQNEKKVQNHYLLFSDGPFAEALKAMNASHEILPFKPRLSRPDSHRKVFDLIKEILEQRKIDLVHSTMAYAAIFAAPACAKMKVPHIWFQHGPASGWMDRLAALLPHRAMIVNSDYIRRKQRSLERPIRFLLNSERQVVKLRLGTSIPELDKEKLDWFRKKLLQHIGLKPDRILIAMLCRIQPSKGVHILVDAIGEIQHQDPNHRFTVLIWGKDFRGKKYYDKLTKFVRDNQLPVYFLGETNEAKKALAGCDILVNASTTPEGFGLTIVEGMSAKTAVIGPNEGGPAEIIEHEANGLLFEARDPSSLAEQIKKLANLAILEKFKRLGYASAQRDFLVINTIRDLEEFYLELLS